MAILDILPIDHPLLTDKFGTMPVDTDDDAEMHRVRILIGDMFDTCKARGGAGLAANQVGSHDRVFVMDMSAQGIAPLAFINPEIVERSEQMQVREEGCLSMRGVFFPVERHARVQVKFQDLNGVHLNYDAIGYAAIVCQHEIDHLNGIRHLDHVSSLKQMMLMQRWEKLKRQGKA